MMNIVNALKKYHAKNVADAYIIAFHARKQWYMVTVQEIPPEWVKLDKIASSKVKKGISADLAYSLRLNMNKAVREMLADTEQAVRIDGNFLALDKNKGRAFERYVREMHGLQHSNDAVPFWIAGDAIINGVSVQIKYETAQLSPLWNL